MNSLAVLRVECCEHGLCVAVFNSEERFNLNNSSAIAIS